MNQPRLGRLTFASVTATGGPILSGSDRRLEITFSAPPSDRVTISNDPNPTLDNGFNLYPGNPPLHLTYASHGGLVCKPWYAISALQTQTIGVIESEACTLGNAPYGG